MESSLSLFLRGIALFIWMAVIFFFSSLVGSESPSTPTLYFYLERKGAHVIEYAVLLWLAVRFFWTLFPRESFHKILLIAAAFSLTYGISDELHQFFVPYRGAKITDVLIDSLGIFLASSVLLALARLGRRTRS